MLIFILPFKALLIVQYFASTVFAADGIFLQKAHLASVPIT
ncbi:hypothetical protein RV10_GL001101 [Enterococcus pallens]|nr:hypothetical protein RV10_GL001101 [Enterococcus pallens]